MTPRDRRFTGWTKDVAPPSEASRPAGMPETQTVGQLRAKLTVMAAAYEQERAEVERLRDLLRRALSLFPVERSEWGGDPEWVAAIKRDVADALG